MSDILNTSNEEEFWTKRYKEEQTGWDIGYPSTPIKTYIDQLTNKDIKILIPGAGNAYEAAYFWEQGFKNVFILDISTHPLTAFQKRFPGFPSNQLLNENFFEHSGQYDLIIEQTFFCSFPPLPENREAYAKKMAELLASNGKLVGLYFDIPLTGDLEKRPFGGTKEEYLSYFEPYFHIKTLESAYNSIKPRMGNELFGIFIKES